MYSLLLITFFTLFTFITWFRFSYGLFLLLLLLPIYLIRFSIGPIPTTMLEVMLLIVLGVFVLRNKGILNLESRIWKKNKGLLLGIGLFLLGATISVFTSLDLRAAAGEWKAFYVEPILFFLLMVLLYHNTKFKILHSKFYILFPLILSGLATSLLAIYQHFTGWMVPFSFWENNETFRVTAWYGFPNAVGLFLAPLIPLALYGLIQQIKKIQETNSKKQKTSVVSYLYLVICILFLATAPFAIFFAKSTGALIGMAAGVGLLLLFWKKTRWPTVILSLVSIVSLVSLSSLEPIRQELFLQDRSGQIRVAMWGEATELLSDRPLLGAGLASYQERVEPYHTTVAGEGIEIFHHPHNIFLTMWVNTGLIGLVGFIAILAWYFRTGIETLKKSKDQKIKRSASSTRSFPHLFSLLLISSMVTILVMGLVDSPYIKNDLAILFWILPALMIASTQKSP